MAVSCQALPHEPLFGAEIMARMAMAAQQGGAAAIRATLERAGLAAHCGAEPGDCIFFGAGSERAAKALLGAYDPTSSLRVAMLEPRPAPFPPADEPLIPFLQDLL